MSDICYGPVKASCHRLAIQNISLQRLSDQHSNSRSRSEFSIFDSNPYLIYKPPNLLPSSPSEGGDSGEEETLLIGAFIRAFCTKHQSLRIANEMSIAPIGLRFFLSFRLNGVSNYRCCLFCALRTLSLISSRKSASFTSMLYSLRHCAIQLPCSKCAAAS
jgi:hypothetical protein